MFSEKHPQNCRRRIAPKVSTRVNQVGLTIIIFFTGLLITVKGVNATLGYWNNYVHVSSFALQPDNKIIVAGEAQAGDVFHSNFLVRLNVDGTLDLEFDIKSSVEKIALQPDGKILVSEYGFSKPDRLLRFNDDGSIDSNFKPEQYLSKIRDIAVQSDGKILIVGYANSANAQYQNVIYRLHADGQIDTSFKLASADSEPSDAERFIETIALLPDGKYLIGGRFHNINGKPHVRFKRLQNDGSVDVGFNLDANYPDTTHYPFAFPEVRSLAIQPDGKIIVSGLYVNAEGRYSISSFIRRLNPNGSIDSTFDPNIMQGVIASMSIQPDGKILIGGQGIDSPKNLGFNNIVRINPDGSRDVTFKASTGNLVTKIVVLHNNKILVGGALHGIYTGVKDFYEKDQEREVNGLVRLNPDGSIDDAYMPWTDDLMKFMQHQ